MELLAVTDSPNASLTISVPSAKARVRTSDVFLTLCLLEGQTGVGERDRLRSLASRLWRPLSTGLGDGRHELLGELRAVHELVSVAFTCEHQFDFAHRDVPPGGSQLEGALEGRDVWFHSRQQKAPWVGMQPSIW